MESIFQFLLKGGAAAEHRNSLTASITLGNHGLILIYTELSMKVVFLGNWSSKLTPGKVNTSFVVDGKIVFDFGPHTISAMLEKGVDPNEVEHVLISHMHYDHFAGLTGLLWYRAMSGNEENLTITGPTGIEETSRKLLALYRTPQGFKIYAEFNESDSESWIESFPGDHTIHDNGYRIKRGGRVLFYSGDTAFSPSIVEGAHDADLLIHEMTYPDELRIEANLWKHSTVSDALRTLEESGSKRLVPVHLTEDTYRMIPALQNRYQQLFDPQESIIL